MAIRKFLREETGWTLVELSLSMMMISFMTLLALPAFVQWGDRLERELFLRGMAADLRFAQVQSRLTEEETVFLLQPSQGVYVVLQDGHLLRREALPTQYKIASNYPHHQVVFRKSGQVRGGTFHLIRGGERVGKIVVQVASGRVRVEVDP
ncbi:GspH/FimT family pseudopilin [Marininema halotolerans]|uniref:Tfp pilus assembly protein FimT n=1 Tax=Marininema halotolerans TaxID=1155944 RepID=A0A1I6ST39_9BACL|nr:GspH/FimT family pseudopilin [Marininema halotolerans]SFS80094.1 Tfp pilus assembly protein FimT [Marininema halotolerans]